MPAMEYEVRLIAKNKYGDTAASTLYRVNTQARQGIYVLFMYISMYTVVLKKIFMLGFALGVPRCIINLYL